MKTEEKVVDKVLDTLIDEAAADIYKKESETEIPKVEFSAEHERKMEKLFRKEQCKYNLCRASHVAGRVACFLLVIVIAMSIAIYSVEAWRIKFLNFVFDKDAPDTEITFTETKPSTFSNDVIDIGYIPAGFEVEKNKCGVDNVFLTFANEEEYFKLKMNKLAFNSAVNTEDGIVESITVNGHEGVYIVNEAENIFLWHDGVYVFRLTANMEREELMKIAESVAVK